jgi:hypothetical protein
MDLRLEDLGLCAHGQCAEPNEDSLYTYTVLALLFEE